MVCGVCVMCGVRCWCGVWRWRVRGTGTGTFPFSTLKACAFKKLLLLLPTCHLLRASDNYTTTLSIYIQDPS